MSEPTPVFPQTTISELLARYEALLLDAYGVLVDGGRALPGAGALIARLEGGRVPYFVVTNDASRSALSCARRYQALGLPVPEDRVVTSGMLLARFFAERRLQGAECVVLGTEDSRAYVRQAGGVVVPLGAHDGRSVRVVVVCDEHGFPFLDHVDEALSLIFQKLDSGEPVELVVPNPDLIYPKAEGRFGVASGSIALVLEAALALRYPAAERPRFVRLGKPHRPIYEAALERAGTRRAVMVGDQLETDVRGANAAGIDSALVTSGITAALSASLPAELRPTWLLPTLVG